MHTIENTTYTIEYEIPTVAEFSKRIDTISREFPYIFAIDNGKQLVMRMLLSFILAQHINGP